MEEPISQPEAEVLSTKQEPSEIETLKNLLAVEHDKYVRLMAEFDNMRKRQERERMELIKYAHEEVIVESLKIYDDLERSLMAFKAMKKPVACHKWNGVIGVSNSLFRAQKRLQMFLTKTHQEEHIEFQLENSRRWSCTSS